jgi:hypothetical protein
MRARSSLGGLFSAVLVTASVFSPSLSRANGRFPLADQLVVDPQDPTHLVLRSTYGILSSSDSGGSWSWVCEAAVGYGGTQDPAMGVLADGTVLAGIFEGLSISHDRGCSWAFAKAPLEGEYVIDVSVHRDEPSRAVAITSTGMGTGFHVILAETSDNGVTWTQAGNAVMNDMLALTVDVAPSNPSRVYVSGSVGKVYAPAIERTNDRGMNWTRSFFDAAYAKDVPYIAGVDPTNPDRLYVRLSGTDSDHLLFSEDGAQTFTEIFTTASDLLGFALSPDGKRLAIGTPMEGIFVASTTDHAFTKVSSAAARCLTWSAAGIYACANEFVDTFTLGLSTDEGKTFSSLYKLREICPVECPTGSSASTSCTAAWPPLAATIGVDQAACGIVTTTSSSSSSGGTSPPNPNPGCGCDLANSPRQTLAGIFALGSFIAAWRRKRTRRS